jgi:hypothetical protein
MTNKKSDTIITKHTLVRKHYEDQGYEVRIDEGGHVEFRTGDKPWRDGYWLTDYRVFDGHVVTV